MQNRNVSYFEECLSLGQWLSQADKRALYTYLLKKNDEEYKSNAKKLLSTGTLMTSIANGEIKYKLENNLVSYVSRELGSDQYTEIIREYRLNKLKFGNIRKLKKFFAQCDVEVLNNFPLPGSNPQPERSFSINAYPFYDLAYYSNGKGRISGLMNKLKTNDSEILKKLKI